MKTFKIFLASSGTLAEERTAIGLFIGIENKRLIKQGVFIELVVWEELLKSFRGERIQNSFNQQMLGCDMVIALFFDRVGEFTLEEFTVAYDSLKQGKRPNYLLVFFKKALIDIDAVDPGEIAKIKKLKEKIQQFEQIYCSYTSLPDLKMQIKSQLEMIPELQDSSFEKPKGKKLRPVSLDLFKPYCRAALTEHRHLPIKGFVTNFRATIEIKNIYVNMRAHVHATEFDYTLDGMRKLKEFEEREKLTDLDLKAAIKAAVKRDIKDLVILGNPGSGKTTLLKYLLVMLVEGRAEETVGLDSGLIPFFAPLRELRDPGKQDFVEFLAKQCKLAEFNISPDDFRALLQSGNAIILLDGLDEVADAGMRINTCHWIDKARRCFGNARFMVTSRFAGYFGESRLEGNLIELGIQDFNIREIEQFLNYWFETIELLLHPSEDEAHWRKEAVAEAADLLDNIKKNPHVRGLATNPLMLQIIACIRKDRGTVLPERRVELYQECVEVFLERWDLAKNMPVAFRGREARAILQPLALWLHEQENRRSAPLDQIIKVIRKPLEKMNKPEVDPKKLLLSIRDRSGIFMGYNETEYGFTHLSFQEYLAAEEIRKRVTADPNAIDLLVKNYGNRWWREVTLLSLALDNPSLIDLFMARIVYEKAFESEPTVVSDAIKEAVSKPFDLITTVINGGKISPSAQANLVQIMHEHGKGVFTPGVKKIKTTVRLAKPYKSDRIINEKDLAEMVLVPAGTFLYGSREDDKEARTNEKPQQSLYVPEFYIDVYPVTNEQYCRFLNDAQPEEKRLKEWVDIGGKGDFPYKDAKNCLAFKGSKFVIEKGFEKHPVIVVSCHGAQEYAKWVGCRLPSEVEWEKAARGTDGRRYPWGDEFKEDACNFEQKYKGTTEVGRFEKGRGPYGCFDMAGNVWEWCADWYSSNEKNPNDPLKGPDKGEFRVLRGGSWVNNLTFMRCANRVRNLPISRDVSVGFRCVR
jgi:formylglycine-generating enzyme required for sulfatase activity